MPLRRYRERGLVLPSWLALASLGLVAIAVLALFVTSPAPAPTSRPVSDVASQPREVTPSPTDSGRDHPRKERPPRERQPQTPQAYVEVYNNSTITGLAARTAGELRAAGWNVVSTGNWSVDIKPETTVYYPAGLRDQARLLARDLGADRVLPAVSPMRFDLLTVILTASA